MIDSQLMERYVVSRDSSAFRDLVDRHGSAVLRVCRRFVHDPHAAEDAMQATFLILVQRAPSIRDPEQLDRWLAGVAHKVAARARKREVRRLEREQRWAETHREATLDAEKPLGVEIRRAVREELGQLPDADRQPLTLCYLDGLTHEEAARRIGCPVGTIKARLVRARRRLRDRLDRRGVALSLGLLLLLLRQSSSVAAESLSRSTAEAMAWTWSNDLEAVEARYPRAWELTRSASFRSGWWAKAPMLAMILGLAVAVFGSGTMVYRSSVARAEAKQASARLAKVLDVNCRITP